MNTSNQDSDPKQENTSRNLNRDIHQRLQKERFPEANMAKESRRDADLTKKNSNAMGETGEETSDEPKAAESADH